MAGYYGFGTRFQVAGSLARQPYGASAPVNPASQQPSVASPAIQPPTPGMQASQRPGLSGPQFNPNATPLSPDLGAGRSAIVPARSANRFLGLNTETPAETLGQWETPNAVNIDGIRNPGIIQPRLGVVKCTNSTANTIGINCVPLYFDVNGSQQMLLVSQYGATVATASLQPVSLACNVPPVREQIPTPTMTVVNNGSGNFSVRLTALQKVGGIERVLVAWNRRGQIPTSPYQSSVRYSDNASGYTWYGDTSFGSGNIASGLTTVGTVYVTAWVESRTGRSSPVSGIRRVTA